MDFVVVNFVESDRATLGFIIDSCLFDQSSDDIFNVTALGNKNFVVVLRLH